MSPWNQLRAWWRGVRAPESTSRAVLPEEVRPGEFKIPLPHRKEKDRGGEVDGMMGLKGFTRGSVYITASECDLLLQALTETRLDTRDPALFQMLLKLRRWYKVNPHERTQRGTTHVAGPRPAVWSAP